MSHIVHSVVLVLLTTLLMAADSFKVLYVTTVPSPSHGHLAQGHLRALLKKGHQVTMITPFPIKNPPANLTQIDVSHIVDSIDMTEYQVDKLLKKGYKEEYILNDWISLMTEITPPALKNENVQNLIMDKKQNFDLVVVDWFYTELPAGFAALYQCPLVFSSSLGVHSGILRVVHDVANPSYTDDVMHIHPKPFTFLQRLETLWMLLGNLFLLTSLKSSNAEYYQEVFAAAAASRGLTLPPYEDVMYNVSLVLANTHPSMASPTALPQNVKAVAGYFIDVPTKPLPSNLQKIMDDSKDGVIYFSFGTNAKSKNMPEEMKLALIKVFAGLKQTVLWKYEEDLPDLPKNLIIQKWMPQSSILAHPNIKIFITHGGLLSTTETVHFGVPVIGVPLFGDQFVNMDRAVSNGFGVKVVLSMDLANDIKGAIEKILSNPSYTRTAKRVSALYHDRPVRASEELVYWLEYAVRTGGAPHLRSAALLLPWYQRLYLDLLAVILVILVALVSLLKYIVILCRGKQNDQKKKKQ